MTDRRTFKDRRDLWAEPKKQKEVQVEKPKAKIKHVEVPTDPVPPRKPRTKRGEQPPPAEGGEQPAQQEEAKQTNEE